MAGNHYTRRVLRGYLSVAEENDLQLTVRHDVKGSRFGDSKLYRDLRRFAWRRPLVYRTVNAFRRRIPMDVENYDLIIEGYPRSANTWTSFYLQITQPHLRVLHHCHVPPPVIRTVRMKKPVLLLIREPLDAALSYAYLLGKETITRKLEYYVDYYSSLLDVRHMVTVVSFEKAVEAPDVMVRQLQGRLGLPLDTTRLTQESINEVTRRIRTYCTKDGQVDERHLNLPSADRHA